MVKSVFKSKTLWVNIAIAVVLGLLGTEIGVDPQMELLLLCLVNIGLRFISKEPLNFGVNA